MTYKYCSIFGEQYHRGVQMLKKILVYIFAFHFIATNAMAQTNLQIEIFDIQQGKVIKYVQKDTDIQEEVGKLLEGITGVYVHHNPIPNKGWMIRIPLEPNIMTKNQWFDDLVDEVIIIFTGQESPYLMMFDGENKPYFFTFEGNTANLMALLNFKP